jgi:hypothetical protein
VFDARFRLPSYHINYTVGFVPGCDIYSGYDELVPKGLDFFGRRSLTANIVNRKSFIEYSVFRPMKTSGK